MAEGFDRIGTDYLVSISKMQEQTVPLRRWFRRVLASMGYLLNWTEVIAPGDDGNFDNSVYRVRNLRFDPNQQILQTGMIVQGETRGYGQPLGQEKEVPKEEICCAKIVSLSYYRGQMPNITVAACIRELRKEGDMLMQLRHPNIIRVYDFLPLPDRKANFLNPYMAIIMQLMGGTLAQLVIATGGPERKLPENQLKLLTRDMLNGLDFLHSGPHRDPNDGQRVHITHNAILQRNILYKTVGNQTIFKLGDFEMIQIIRDNQIDPDAVLFWSNDMRQLARLFVTLMLESDDKRMSSFHNDMEAFVWNETYHFMDQTLGPNNRVEYPTCEDLLQNEWLNE